MKLVSSLSFRDPTLFENQSPFWVCPKLLAEFPSHPLFSVKFISIPDYSPEETDKEALMIEFLLKKRRSFHEKTSFGSNTKPRIPHSRNWSLI
jgi:hypothetical protein